MRKRVGLTTLLFLLLSSVILGCSKSAEESNASQETAHEETTQGNQEETAEKESQEKDAAPKEDTAQEEASKDDQSIKVDKGIMNVEITLPASVFQNQDKEAVIQQAKESGVKEVIENDDGSITYKMSKSVHDQMLKSMKEDLVKTIEEMKTSGDFASIKDITHNETFTEFTLSVQQDAYENSMDGFAVYGLGLSGMIYQLYDGAEPDKTKVTIHVKNADSGEVFDTIVYPDSLNQ